jgi:hypothetical protein
MAAKAAAPLVKEGVKFLLKEVVVPTVKGLGANIAKDAAGQIAQGALERLHRAGLGAAMVQQGQQFVGVRVIQAPPPVIIREETHKFPTHCSCRPTQLHDPRDGKEQYVISLCDVCSVNQRIGERQFQQALGAFRQERAAAAARFENNPAGLLPPLARGALGIAEDDEAGAAVAGAGLLGALRNQRRGELDIFRVVQQAVAAARPQEGAVAAALAPRELFIPLEDGVLRPAEAVAGVGAGAAVAAALGNAANGGVNPMNQVDGGGRRRSSKKTRRVKNQRRKTRKDKRL